VEDILAIILIFGGGSAFLLAVSPVGRAIADRIRTGGQVANQASVERLQEAQQAMLEDLEAMRQELGEVQERLDFAERLLAQHREGGRLPAGGATTQPPER
jgi:hypothetical protein